MQIQSTKPNINIKKAQSPEQTAPPQEQQQAEAPKESFIGSVTSEALGNGRHFANRVGNGVGKMGGLIGAGLGATAAVTGGAMVGMAAGGAIGAPLAVLFSDGGMSAFKTGLSAIGTGGQIGIGLGLLTLAAGGWVVGDFIAGWAGKIAAYPIGMTTGAVSGGLRHIGTNAGALPPKKREKAPEKKPIVDKNNPVLKWTRRGLGGAGGLIGLTGGAIVGLGAAAGFEAISQFMGSGFSGAALTSAAITGAAVGGATGMVVGGIGGATIANKIHGVVNGIAAGGKAAQKLAEQDKQSNLMDELRAQLESGKKAFEIEKQAGEENIADRNESLTARSKVLNGQRQELNDKLTNEAGLTQARSNELYTNETDRLATYEAKLDGEKAFLDSEEVRLTNKEDNIDNLIREEATNRRENHRNAEQSKHDTRKGNLENRERKLQKKEANIGQIANDKVQAELQPMRDEAASARNQAASNRRQASNLQSEASRLDSQVSGLLSDARRMHSEADSVESNNNSLRREKNSLEREESRLESDLRECERRKAANRPPSNPGRPTNPGRPGRPGRPGNGSDGHRDRRPGNGSDGHR